MTPVIVHRLTGKDLSTNTATCSVCGPVGIAKAGNGFQCEIKKKASQKAWRQAHPERSAADRRRRSTHELFAHDYVGRKATCSVCGPTDLVYWGRGDICGVRARELRSVQEEAPSRPCRECLLIDGIRVYPTGDVCSRCTDPARCDTGKALRYAAGRGADLDGVDDGFTVEDITGDPYAMDDYESAVPGWRTLGSSRPWKDA